MWARRQLKAQRYRGSQRSAPSVRDRHDCLLFCVVTIASGVLVVLATWFHETTRSTRNDGNDDLRPRMRAPESLTTYALRFLYAYPQRFYAFYAPKIALLTRWARAAIDALELSDDTSASLDFAVALVSVVSVYHAIEICRRTLLSRLQRAHTRTASDSVKRNEQHAPVACDAF